MKKRVGLLAALALCVTVGGVYATWNYVGTDGMSGETEATLGLTEAVTTDGSLTVTNNSLTFLIDDTNDDHIGDAVVASGSVTVTYEAEANNNEDFTIYCNVSFGGTEELFATTLTLNELNKAVDLDGNAQTITWTVNAADLKIVLGDDQVILPTKAAYDAYVVSAHATIKVTFSTEA